MYLNKGGSNSLFGRLGYILSLLLLIGILHQNVALGSPLAKRDDDIEPDDPDSDNDDQDTGSPFSPTVDNYPDLTKCREKVSVAKDKSVFYSGVGKHEDKPQSFADQLPNGVLLREAYPSGFTDKNDDWTGYKKFLERASQAFAEKSSGIVYVLLPTDKTDISKKVWTKIEKDKLTSNSAVERIVKVDPDDFTKKCVLSGSADNDLSSCDLENGPVPGKDSKTLGYTPGWCGVHVIQYQKANPSDPSSHYHLDVTIYDGAQKQIGQVTNQDAPSGQGVNVDSALPFVLIVTAQNVDADAVLFKYADQSWGSNDQDHHCDFGAYDSGNRYVLIPCYRIWLRGRGADALMF
ncbi:uncharacterized protein KY384_002356 [Bacidia gigantensis]|uniref:uncharacterized protein n=1 Tax=Bacidia gigantensis TaxID=2732470 RepID=UPI001D04C15C|nr:uncharacterized protein KY384_002356 [Bacidia gigantensis]KAG8532479.1 hypothetical protein KY384_002356 [Bacidia gigantensis]